MSEFIQFCFSWPTVIPSVVLSVVVVYWLLVMLGALGLDLFDFDLDPGIEGHESLLDWGLVGLRWFNLGNVPLMIWLSAFALPAWISASVLNRDLIDPTGMDATRALVRDFVVGVFGAKLLTEPVKGSFRHTEPNPSEGLIGKTVLITSSEASPEFGQAQYHPGDGAPLNLHVRTLAGIVPKGSLARIVDYSPESRLYFIESDELTG